MISHQTKVVESGIRYRHSKYHGVWEKWNLLKSQGRVVRRRQTLVQVLAFDTFRYFD